MDIKLKQWAETTLPHKSIDVAWECLCDEFRKLLSENKRKNEEDGLFEPFKQAVAEESFKQHKWEEKAIEVLRVIQLNALDDRSISDKSQWDAAYNFLETSLKENLQRTQNQVRDLIGPGLLERWWSWKSVSPLQRTRSYIKAELEKLINASQHTTYPHGPTLAPDEMTTVRKNLQAIDVEVDQEMVKQVWYPLYREKLLERALERNRECRKGFYAYNSGLEMDIVCDDIVLFSRVQRMITTTSNALRQQIMNIETRRLEKEIKQVLEELSQDNDKKKSLLTGRRVELAEELSKYTLHLPTLAVPCI